jgi:hypothetical protein
MERCRPRTLQNGYALTTATGRLIMDSAGSHSSWSGPPSPAGHWPAVALKLEINALMRSARVHPRNSDRL